MRIGRLNPAATPSQTNARHTRPAAFDLRWLRDLGPRCTRR
jgi:hypothetical protein